MTYVSGHGNMWQIECARPMSLFLFQLHIKQIYYAPVAHSDGLVLGNT